MQETQCLCITFVYTIFIQVTGMLWNMKNDNLFYGLSSRKQLTNDQIRYLQLHPVELELVQPVICIMLQSTLKDQFVKFSSSASRKSWIIRRHSTINQFLALRKHAKTPRPTTSRVPAAIMLYVEACDVEDRDTFAFAQFRLLVPLLRRGVITV